MPEYDEVFRRMKETLSAIETEKTEAETETKMIEKEKEKEIEKTRTEKETFEEIDRRSDP